jgi:hypothetical protein
MLQITKPQLAKIHVLFHQLGLMDSKKELVRKFSNERTESSRELTMYEAKGLIEALSKFDSCDGMRRKVFALAYEAGIIWGDTNEDKKMNAVKLNQFLLRQGAIKKEIGKMGYQELIKTVNQFSQIIKHKEESLAAKQTKELLNELQIDSAFNRRSKAIN